MAVLGLRQEGLERFPAVCERGRFRQIPACTEAPEDPCAVTDDGEVARLLLQRLHIRTVSNRSSIRVVLRSAARIVPPPQG